LKPGSNEMPGGENRLRLRLAPSGQRGISRQARNDKEVEGLRGSK